MDDSKEQLLGKCHHKCQQAGSHFKQTEPYTPWWNAVEGAIHELKRGVGHEMVQSHAPKWLWDHECLEGETLIWSVMAHNIYSLDGQVPQTIVKGETAKNSTIALFCWYELVMFRDTSIPFPEDNIGTGHRHQTGNDPKDPQGEWTGSLSLHSLIFDRRQIQKWGHEGKM
jgi:hypothetical protein